METLETLEINPYDELEFFVEDLKGFKHLVANTTYLGANRHLVRIAYRGASLTSFSLLDTIIKLRRFYPEMDYAIKGTYFTESE